MKEHCLTEPSSTQPVMKPFKALLNKAAIPCLSDGIQLMKIGERSRIVCPPELVRGIVHTLITPGSTLIYDITLVDGFSLRLFVLVQLLKKPKHA